MPTAMLSFECWMLSYSRLKPAIENWSLRQCWVLNVEFWVGRCYACDDELFNCELMHLTLVLNSWIICGNSWLKVLYACCVTLCHELSLIIHEFNIKHLTLNIGTKPTAMLSFECWMLSCSLLTHAIENWSIVNFFGHELSWIIQKFIIGPKFMNNLW